MTDKSLFDFSRLQNLDKQKQVQNEQLNTLLDQNDLIKKKIPEGPNSLLRAISDALYFTLQYADEIQQFLFKHLTHLITTDKLPPRLMTLRGNNMLLKDYTSNPHLPGFDKINLELVSSQFKAKIIVYSITDDNYLSSIIVNNNYERTIELVRHKNNHYEPVYSKRFMQKIGVAQNMVLNIVEQALNKEANAPFKNINEDSYVNFEYLNWLSTQAENGLGQFRITRGKHKKSFSDSFNKPPEDQMKFYDMFTNTKPPDDFLRLLRQRKDTAESNFSINADFDFMDEPWHEAPSGSATKNNISTASIKISPAKEFEGNPFPRSQSSKVTTGLYFRDNQGFGEKPEKNIIRDTSNISPVHFINTAPPGLTPSRYPQKSFTYTETHAAIGNEGLASSPTFQQRPESLQTINSGLLYRQTTPTRESYLNLSQNQQGMSPISQQNMNSLYTKRTGNPESLILSIHSSEGLNPPSGTGFDQAGLPLSASKEKKKPIILDESKERYTGRLKFFDETKNYGFIIMDEDNSDIFVHMDDLMKANITKEMLKNTKNGVVLRLTFSCMKYIGKYQKSRKATDIEIIP